LEALVADQRLLERGLALDHVDEVVDHPALAAHDQVEVAQADVEVDDSDLLAGAGEAAGEGRAGGGLADAALAGRDYDDFSQCGSPVRAAALGRKAIGFNPSRQDRKSTRLNSSHVKI